MNRTERAGIPDIEALVQMRMAYLREDSGYEEKDHNDPIRTALPEYFLHHLNRDLFCYVIREADEIVSCAFLLVQEKPMSPSFPNGKTGTLLNVYTKPAYRKRGYARQIMQRLTADAEKMELCTLELKSTEDGYPLYCSAGFAEDHSYRLMKWKNRHVTGE